MRPYKFVSIDTPHGPANMLNGSYIAWWLRSNLLLSTSHLGGVPVSRENLRRIKDAIPMSTQNETRQFIKACQSKEIVDTMTDIEKQMVLLAIRVYRTLYRRRQVPTERAFQRVEALLGANERNAPEK